VTFPTNERVPLLSEQLAQDEPDDQLERAQIYLSADPAIYIPGTPLELSWKVKGVQNHKGKVSVVFTLPAGVTPVDKKISSQLASDNTYTVDVKEDKNAKIVLSVGAKAQLPFYISAHLVIEGEDEVYSSDAVYINGVTLEATREKAKSASGAILSGFNGNAQIKIKGDALTEDLIFDMRPPSPNKMPGYTLSNDPVEIIAVGKQTKKNVTRFNQPVTLELKYDEKKLSDRVDEKDLQVFYYNEEEKEWFPMETVVDPASNTLTVQTDHLTVFDYKAASWQGYVPPDISTFQVSDFTGAATYSVNLWTPAGSAGFQPGLTLSYNSQVIDEGAAFTQASWVGSGWSLDTRPVFCQSGQECQFMDRLRQGRNDLPVRPGIKDPCHRWL